MATRAILLRLKSIKNIQKITKSMKLVSAAKYARAERELKAAKPFGQTMKEILSQVNIDEAIVKETAESAELRGKQQLFVAVSSDRGLAGAVHTSVARHIRNEIQKKDDPSRIVCIGEKCRSILQRQFKERFVFVCNEVGRLPPTFLDACRIANEIIEMDFNFGKIVYNRFVSVVSYVTSETKIYSLAAMAAANMDYEELEGSMEDFAEFSMAVLIYYAMKEGACSEQSARMNAMDNASKNAGEMIDKLTLAFNRTRQAGITKELIEIISGASAIE